MLVKGESSVKRSTNDLPTTSCLHDELCGGVGPIVVMADVR